MKQIEVIEIGNPDSIGQCSETKWLDFKKRQLAMANEVEDVIIRFDKAWHDGKLFKKNGEPYTELGYKIKKGTARNFVLRLRRQINYFENERLNSK